MNFEDNNNNYKKKACFFSHEKLASLKREQYSIQDINILQELGYSVVIANSFSGIPWNCDLYFSWWASGSFLPLIKARLVNKPIIVVAGGNEAMFYRDSVTLKPAGYLATPWYKKLATRLSLRLSSVVLVVSDFMVKDATKLGAVNPIVVHNCINTTTFNLSKLERSYITSIFNLDENVMRIKRGEVLIKAIPAVLNIYPDQKFIFIGKKGNAYERLQCLVKDLNIDKNVNFIGSIDNTEVVKWLQQSKVYLQISDTETFGVSIAEAMSCGTPVVVSRRGAIPELVGDCGVFVDHNDPNAVAEGIIEILAKDEKEYNDIGNKARNRVIQYFSYEHRKKSIEKIISELTQ